MATGSVPFDRAAEYYDRTRGLAEAAAHRQTELLLGELRGRGRVLEVGVGTGQIALPLAAEGIAMVGVDLSGPMLARLLAKAGGSAPWPLLRADATRLPLAGDVFGAAVLRWVLHLIADWRTAVREMIRVVDSGGLLLMSLGGYDQARRTVRERFGELTGVSMRPIGLGWGRWEELDELLASLGASVRPLPEIVDQDEEPLAPYLEAIEANRYSWTWPVPEELRRRTMVELRTWAEQRFGPLDVPKPSEYRVRWHAYDLP